MPNTLSRWSAAAARLSLATRFRLAGIAVAIVGLAWAAWIRLTVAETPVRAIPFDRLKVEERQLEVIGGKFAVEAARLTRWFDGLWVGRDLATTLAVLSVAGALILFWLARIAAIEPVDDEDPRDRR
ncbi:hypothetical protein [Pinisolibacter sp.]|uniref:hypothetical protein n=1 Tax=Pinisolibacter sp. TaxID=2172024 RepID=UPI002FDD6739